MRFTTRTVVLLALSSVLALVGYRSAMAFVMLGIAVVATVDAFVVRHPPQVRRTIGGFARGVPSTVEIVVEAPNASAVSVRQPLPPDMTSSSATSTQPKLSATLVPLQRGRYELPIVAVSTDGPLGLGRWFHELGEPMSINVYPDLPAAQRLASAVRNHSIRAVGARRHGPLGLGTEFESVREYRTDDDVRQINWRATARLGRAMSNNLRVEQDIDVWIIVDTGRLMAASFNGLTAPANRLDSALDAAAAIGLVADDLRDRVGFVAYAEEVVKFLPPRRSGGETSIEAAFSLTTSDAESDHEAGFSAVSSTRRGLAFVFTDLIDAAAAETLAASLPSICRRHLVTVVCLDDPEHVRARNLGTRAEKIAVADIDAATAAAARKISAQGASVLLAPPDQLAEATVRAYVMARSGR